MLNSMIPLDPRGEGGGGRGYPRSWIEMRCSHLPPDTLDEDLFREEINSTKLRWQRRPRKLRKRKRGASIRKGVPFSTPFLPLTFTSFTTLLTSLRFSGDLRRRNGRLPRNDWLLRSWARCEMRRRGGCRCSLERRGSRRKLPKNVAARWAASC